MASRWEVTRAIRASELPAPSRLVMLVLADVAEVGTAEIPERFTPSLNVLARETGLDKSTVRRHLNTLEEFGWVVRMRPTPDAARMTGERTRYRLDVPPGGYVPPALEAEDNPLGAESPQARGTQPLGLEAQSPQPRGTVPLNKKETDLTDLTDQTDPSSSSDAAHRPDVEKVCEHLADRISGNGSKRPTITKRWRDAARLMLDRDGRSVDQIIRAIDWCQDDAFWRSNILSMPKLRDKYDQLRLAAQRGHRRPDQRSNTDIDWDAAMARAQAREAATQ